MSSLPWRRGNGSSKRCGKLATATPCGQENNRVRGGTGREATGTHSQSPNMPPLSGRVWGPLGKPLFHTDPISSVQTLLPAMEAGAGTSQSALGEGSWEREGSRMQSLGLGL